MAHSPPKKVLAPLSKRDKRLPWNTTSGTKSKKEGKGKIVRDGKSPPVAITTKTPFEFTSLNYRKKKPPKAHQRTAKLPNLGNQERGPSATR